MQQSGTVENVKQNDRPDELPEGAHLERREDGSVWQVTKAIRAKDEKTGKDLPGPDTLEFRVDSPKDVDFIAKGGTPWYYKYLPEVSPNAGKADSTAELLASLTARLDKAEARADAAEAAVPEAINFVGDDSTTPNVVAEPPIPAAVALMAEGDGKIVGTTPSPAVATLKKSGKKSSKK